MERGEDAKKARRENLANK
jgi:hypothetical protein